MGFFTGVITGIAVAAGAAAWYMSRSGSNVREQYRIENRLGELGDQLEARTRDIQAMVNAQLSERRGEGETAGMAAASTNGHDAAEVLDEATATAAEAAAEVAAEADAITERVKAKTKDVAENGAG